MGREEQRADGARAVLLVEVGLRPIEADELIHALERPADLIEQLGFAHIAHDGPPGEAALGGQRPQRAVAEAGDARVEALGGQTRREARGAVGERRIEVGLPQGVGLDDVAVDVDDAGHGGPPRGRDHKNRCTGLRSASANGARQPCSTGTR